MEGGERLNKSRSKSCIMARRIPWEWNVFNRRTLMLMAWRMEVEASVSSRGAGTLRRSAGRTTRLGERLPVERGWVDPTPAASSRAWAVPLWKPGSGSGM
jgi:hypothetical protein